MAEYRLKRVERLLRDEVGSLIVQNQIKDPRVEPFLTVTRVVVSKDLAYAKIHVSSFQDSESLEQGVEGLNHAAGFIQSVIAKKIRLRVTPKLTFFPDRSIEEGFNINQKIRDIQS